MDFYPRSPCGERRRTKAIAAKISNFYPRSPCGERPLHLTFSERAYKFLSTLSLRRATSPVSVMARGIFISIHALLAESDIILRHSVSFSDDFYPRSPCGERLYDTYAKVLRVNISIHALLAESDLDITIYLSNNSISIHALLAESDLHCKTPITFRHYFYPRSPCGERLLSIFTLPPFVRISIHALLAESDFNCTVNK